MTGLFAAKQDPSLVTTKTPVGSPECSLSPLL